MRHSVLYVEDNEDNVYLIKRVITLRSNVDLVVATTGQEGLRLAQEGAPSLVLLDRRLPDMLGNEVLRRLKAERRTTRIPVVMLSGDSDEEQAAELLQLGADEFLAKPFDLTHLLTIIDRCCS